MEKLIFECGSPGSKGVDLFDRDFAGQGIEDLIPEKFRRKKPAHLPEVSEPEIVRHFVNLSQLNHHVDKGFYPLGSCTMKYNPKVNEETSSLPGFQSLHPEQPESTTQGALQLMADMSAYLCEIAGLEAMTLQPSAGAHGELTGLLMTRAFHEDQGNPRKFVLVPDSAHGTNPASVSIAGYKSKMIPSGDDGLVDIEKLKDALNEDVAAFMITNPNTLGLFEKQALEIAELVHEAGALLYMDGANLNALLGIIRPGDLKFDVVHFNLHKTFSTPHGGGGPGSGPIGVSERLADFLPIPCVTKKDSSYALDYDRPKSIGKISTFYGNFGVVVRALTYIRMLGAEGLRRVSESAIINANYLLSQLKDEFDLPFNHYPMHEFVLSGDRQKQHGVRTLDIAKRLLDFGVHAPTVYFPLIVSEAMMIEPTETESKESLDHFASVMLRIAKEAEQNSDAVTSAPKNTPVKRLDEAQAARELNVRYRFSEP